MQALHRIKSSDLAYVAGASVISELDGVISMVGSPAEGVGLSASEIKNFGPFHKSIVGRLPRFHRRKHSDGGGPDRGDLSGRAAIRELLVDVRLQLKDRDALQLKVLQPLRTYSWMLEGLEIVEVNN